jgi:hypothetical protein
MSDDDNKNLLTDEINEAMEDKNKDSDNNDNKEKDGDNIDGDNNEFFKELEELGKMREGRKEENKKKLEKIVKERERMKLGREEGEENEKDKTVIIGGRLTVLKTKDYVPKLKAFKRNKINDLQNKGSDRMENVLHKVHGVSLEKKLNFLKALKAYAPIKSVLKKKDFDEFSRRFKSKNFRSEKFRQAEKESGIDMKELRKKFKKEDIDKIKRGIIGQKDPFKYKSKNFDLKNTTRPLNDKKTNTMSLNKRIIIK